MGFVFTLVLKFMSTKSNNKFIGLNCSITHSLNRAHKRTNNTIALFAFRLILVNCFKFTANNVFNWVLICVLPFLPVVCIYPFENYGLVNLVFESNRLLNVWSIGLHNFAHQQISYVWRFHVCHFIVIKYVTTFGYTRW